MTLFIKVKEANKKLREMHLKEIEKKIPELSRIIEDEITSNPTKNYWSFSLGKLEKYEAKHLAECLCKSVINGFKVGLSYHNSDDVKLDVHFNFNIEEKE